MYHRGMMGCFTDVTSFVLAGGKSTRMGEDKAFVELKGRTLLERALKVARAVTKDVCIVGQPEKFSVFAPTIEDVFQNCGPLAGIHAGLQTSSSDLNLMVAVDLPFITPALLAYLVGRARASSAIVTVPRVGGGWQPLCAVYRCDFARVAEAALRGGRYKIDHLFGSVGLQVVEERELASAGFSQKMFQNLNTSEDLDVARASADEATVPCTGSREGIDPSLRSG